MNNYSNLSKVSFAAALSASIIYSVLTLLHVIFPKYILKLYAAVHHVKTFEPLQSEVTISNYLVGLIFNFVLFYLGVMLAGVVYEAITSKRRTH